VIVHHVASVSGQLTPAAAGRRVLLEVLDPNGGWTVAGTATAGHGGTFSIGWRAAHIGRFTLRAVRAGHASASAVASAPTAVVEVYRSAVASWFGPGFYGNQTACGETMTPELLGVAHPSLPCGTPVDLIYNGHTITVPVVDRGPFVAGVSYDLTAATAQALGMTETSRIGALAEHQA
jgi:rare lipoprotein A (peptidoglycan hydrolase)